MSVIRNLSPPLGMDTRRLSITCPETQDTRKLGIVASLYSRHVTPNVTQTRTPGGIYCKLSEASIARQVGMRVRRYVTVFVKTCNYLLQVELRRKWHCVCVDPVLPSRLNYALGTCRDQQWTLLHHAFVAKPSASAE